MIKKIIIIILIATLFGCASLKVIDYKKYDGWGFQIEIADNISIEEVDKKMDFIIYIIKYKRNDIAKIYAGYNPQYSKNDILHWPATGTTINGLPSQSKKYKLDDRYYGDVLVKLQDVNRQSKYSDIDGSRPVYLHFFYRDLSPENYKIVENIIMTTRKK